VIFPLAPAEARGIEDARFVRFHDEADRSTYYATYTAFDGQVPLPQLFETEDFVRFKISTLNGPEVQNKGMALFPRRCAATMRCSRGRTTRDAGWLVLTHGVGPIRRYAMGAVLLDLNDPGRVIGRLRKPLLEPLPEERDGYVPNVVYSCGALVHAGRLILPYAMSDQCTSFATVPLEELLSELKSQPPDSLL
jgi:predicted GH43/DUF377 family glycosyl hydrolase